MDQKAIGIAMALIEVCLEELSTPKRFRSWDLAFKQQEEIGGERWSHVFVLKEHGRVRAEIICIVHAGEDWTKDSCLIRPIAGFGNLWEYYYRHEGQHWILRSRITANLMDCFYRTVKLALRMISLGGNEVMAGATVAERLIAQGVTADRAGLKQWLERNYNAEFNLSQRDSVWYLVVRQGNLWYPPIQIRNEQLGNVLTVGEFETEFLRHQPEAEAA